jgi:hypothetical protein
MQQEKQKTSIVVEIQMVVTDFHNPYAAAFYTIIQGSMVTIPLKKSA